MRMTRIWALAFLACAILDARAGMNAWTRTGPPGAALEEVEYVNGSGTAVALGIRKIYRTTDHGLSWTPVLAMDFGAYGGLLAANPANSNQILAILDKLYRSADGGATWSAVTTSNLPIVPNGERPLSIAWSRNGSTVWVGSDVGSIYRSTDAGSSWIKSYNGFNFSTMAAQIDVDAVDPNRVYVVTPTFMLMTSNGGTNWFQGNVPFIQSIAASRTQSGVLLAVMNGSSEQLVLRSTDFGFTFTTQSERAPRLIQFAPGSANRVYALGLSFGEVSVSDDQGATWTEGASIVDRGLTDLAISPTDDNRLLVSSQSGTYASTDGGVSWTARKTGQDELFHVGLAQRFVPGGASNIFTYGYSPDGAFRRETGGQWTTIGATSIPELGMSNDFTSFAVAPSDGTLYLGRTGHFGRSTNGGASWTRLGALQQMVRLEVDPSNSQNLFATDQTFNTRRSVDGGVTWTPFGDDLPTDVADFAVNDTNGNRVYAVMRNNINQVFSALYVSNDGGTTWTPTPWPPSVNFNGNVVVHEPGSANTVYVGLSSGLFKTTDGGENWTQLDPYPANVTADDIVSIAIDPRVPQTLYVGINYAYPVMRSVDGGASWEPVRGSSDENFIDLIAIDPNTPAGLVGRVIYGGLMETEIAPDLALTSGAAQVAGTAGSTTLTVTNNGIYTATMVRLTATLPGVTGTPTVQASAGLTCTLTGSDLVCDAPLLRPAATLSATLGFTPTAVGQWQAAVTARESDSATANNSRSITVQSAPANPPPGNNGGGGGGGGRIDYLLLVLLALIALSRTPSLRRRFPSCASALKMR